MLLIKGAALEGLSRAERKRLIDVVRQAHSDEADSDELVVIHDRAELEAMATLPGTVRLLRWVGKFAASTASQTGTCHACGQPTSKP